MHKDKSIDEQGTCVPLPRQAGGSLWRICRDEGWIYTQSTETMKVVQDRKVEGEEKANTQLVKFLVVDVEEQI